MYIFIRIDPLDFSSPHRTHTFSRYVCVHRPISMCICESTLFVYLCLFVRVRACLHTYVHAFTHINMHMCEHFICVFVLTCEGTYLHMSI